MIQTINLNNVPDDIHRLILFELTNSSPSDILNLAQVSKALRDAALPFVYRNIVVAQGPKKSWNQIAYQALVEKFCEDEYHKLARHVRSITVKDGVPSEDLVMILSKVAQSGNLTSLNWETAAHMSRTVYDKIHKTWPNLELRVSVTDRRDAKVTAHRQMDMALLSSPLLVGLTYVIHTHGAWSDRPTRSEWPRLTQALAAGGNVRSLRLQILADGYGFDRTLIVPDTEPEKQARLDLASGLYLPQLEEFIIQNPSHSTYLWDSDYCHTFRDSIDCSRLRTLDFGSDSPREFFSYFTGLLPNLKTLRFAAAANAREPVKSFIESIESLEHLSLAHAQRGIDDLWPAIKKHKGSLKTLVLGPTLGPWCSPLHMDLSLLEAVAASFPQLEHFGWDAPCKASIDMKHLTVLSTMHLKKLDLHLHIPDEASEYSDKLVQDAMGTIPHPLLNKQGSIAAAINIAEAISESQPNPLQWLTLHLSRTGYEDRAQPYMMHTGLQIRRNHRTNQRRESKYSVRGKMDWYYGLPPPEELLLFEEA